MRQTESQPRPVRARNRRGEGARLRDEIVDAAVELLDEAGDERAITLRSVARRVGISAPSIYPHFPDQPAIMLAVVQRALDELTRELRSAMEAAGDDPLHRLWAVSLGYLDFARQRPERYRTMFGGLWIPSLGDNSVTEADLDSLGQEALGLLATAIAECAAAGYTVGSEPDKDTIALWLGLHGLAHQRASTRLLPGPPDIETRMIPALARLRPEHSAPVGYGR